MRKNTKKITLCLILSVLLVITLVPQVSFATEEGTVATASTGTETKVITGFAELETSDYYYEGNPEEEELTLNLPETLKVYLGGSSETTEIPVSWEAVEDFDKTDFYFYSMKPVWGSEYVLDASLSEVLDVPWITVYKQEPENEEVEPIMTEEEIDPIYTEEEGAIDPETTAVEELAEDTAKAIKNVFAEDVYAATSAENTAAIYSYLTGTLGFNTAAACGIMTNINAESAMSPINLQNTYNSSLGLSDEEYTKRVDAGKGAYKTSKGTSKNFKTDSAGYGLCQWTSSGRKTNMLSSAINSGKSIGDLNNQMAFFASELQNSYPQVYITLKNVPNTAAGAYIAAAEMCLSYEIPANTVSTAASRGKTCLSGYWKTYSGSSASVTGTSFVSLCGYSIPLNVKKGSGMTVTGYAVSNYNISSVTAKISNSSGKVLYSQTKKPGTTAYKLSNLDGAMKFSKLSNGKYTYTVVATDTLGKSVTANHTFNVSTSATSKNSGFATVTGQSASSATNNSSAAVVTTVKKAYTGAYPTLPKRGHFKKGDKGTQVKRLQLYLKWAGYSVTTGGKYGTKTIKAVKKFQKANGLKQDGKFGKASLKKAKTIKR